MKNQGQLILSQCLATIMLKPRVHTALTLKNSQIIWKVEYIAVKKYSSDAAKNYEIVPNTLSLT